MLFIRQFHIQLLLRFIAIVLCATAALWLWFFYHLYFTAAGVAALAALLTGGLYYYIRGVDGEIDLFVTAVKNRDNGAWFNPDKYGKPFSHLFDSFNEILEVNRHITIEKETVFQLMNSVLEKAPFGLIVIPSAAVSSAAHIPSVGALERAPAGSSDEALTIRFINKAAEDLLQIPRYKFWHLIAEKHPGFTREVASLAEGGKKFTDAGGGFQSLLSIETQVLWSKEEPLLIISFQDVRNEVEQKEMEAWNKLINVLTHEILNSIAPIHNLAYSIRNLLEEKGRQIDEEDLADLRLGAATIQKRTDGLMGFVQDYRHVAELPTPVLQPVSVNELLQRVRKLMVPQAQKKSVRLEIAAVHARYMLWIDEALIEQVLINLITNSIYAAEGRQEPLISVSFHNHEGQYSLTVSDNGTGIPAENIDKIFVPFFTTRNTGSGIGLTISRNIMKLHSGSIEVHSVVNTGTEFTLHFPTVENVPAETPV